MLVNNPYKCLRSPFVIIVFNFYPSNNQTLISVILLFFVMVQVKFKCIKILVISFKITALWSHAFIHVLFWSTSVRHLNLDFSEAQAHQEVHPCPGPI
jgi:hypothetical protein